MITILLWKYKRACLISLWIFMALTWGNANAAYLNVSDYDATVSVGSGGLNVRKTWGSIVGKVYNDTPVRVLAHDGIWRQVYYSGKVQGWVSSSYLKTSSGSSVKCVGRSCRYQDPASMGCSVAKSEITPSLGGGQGSGTAASHRVEVRMSRDCKASWIRIRNTRYSDDRAWIFAAGSSYYLDTDRMAEGIRQGFVDVDGFQIAGSDFQDFATRPGDKGPTFWSTMVNRPYIRVCVNGNSANFRSGNSAPYWRNCTSLKYLYKNPY